MPRSLLTRRQALSLAVSAALVPSGAALAAQRRLRGTVFYRERMALPPGATVEVSLLDVSLADAPATTIARTRLRAGAGGRTRYSLRYDEAAIQPGRRYALRARIELNGELLFISTDHHPVPTDGKEYGDILVRRATRQAEPAGSSPSGRWLAENIGGGGVMDRLQTTLEIEADGRVGGSGGCNRFSGKATIEGRAIRFLPIAATQMACSSAAMAQEQKFFAALGAVRRWELNVRHGKLALLGADGRPLVVFARM